jgi:hypothetical protein
VPLKFTQSAVTSPRTRWTVAVLCVLTAVANWSGPAPFIGTGFGENVGSTTLTPKALSPVPPLRLLSPSKSVATMSMFLASSLFVAFHVMV